MLFDCPLPGIYRQLCSGRGVRGRFQCLAGSQVAIHQRPGTLQLPPGVFQNGLFAGQRRLIIPVPDLLRSDLGFKVFDLCFGLGQRRLDIGIVQCHQKLALLDPPPLGHGPRTDSTGQGCCHRQLLRGQYFAIQGQHRGMRARLNFLNLDTPTALGGTDLCRLRAGHFENHETGDTDGENQQGNQSFGHYLQAS